MGSKKSRICVSTKIRYGSVIVALLIAIVVTLFPPSELFSKKSQVKNIVQVNPTHSPPTDIPTPTHIQIVLFPNNPNAEKAMRILKDSKYGYSYYVLSSTDQNKPLFDGLNGNSGDAYHFLEYLGTDESNTDVLKLRVVYAMYPVASDLTEEYLVNIKTGEVKPTFPSMDLFNTILNPTLKQVQILGTNKSLMLPEHFNINSKENELGFSQPKIVNMVKFCAEAPEYKYCQDFSHYLGKKLQIIGQQKPLGANVRLIEWAGTPHEWALDNVGWQGSTYRETLKKYPEFIGTETVTLGNNDFYKIGEGCCGDRSYSYITKGFSGNGTPLLIIFRASGEQKKVEGKEGVRTMPYLEEILKTMN